MAVAFRSVFQFPSDREKFADLGAIVNLWLLDKGWSGLPDEGTIQRESSSLSVVSIREPIVAKTWRLSEVWTQPAWAERVESKESLTSVTLINDSETIWAWIEIETPTITWTDSNTGQVFTEPQKAESPRLVHNLIRDAKPFDGLLPVFDHIPVLASGAAKDLANNVIPDKSRFGEIFVTSPPIGVSSDDWKAKISRLFRPSRGMGSAFVVDAGALRVFNEAVGSGLSIASGSMRSFLPGAILGDEDDSVRHRMLTARSMANTVERRISNMLRHTQLTRLNTVRLPALFIEAERLLTRALRYSSVALVRDPDSETTRRDLEAMEAIARSYEADASRLTGQLAELRTKMDEMWLENSELSEANYTLEKRVSHLRQVLTERGLASEAFTEAEPEDHPISFEDLLDKISTLPHLTWAGKEEPCLELDSLDTPRSALNKAWSSLRSLSSYASKRASNEFTGGLDAFIRDGSHGGFNSIAQIKSEGESVRNNPKFRQQREIRVPKEINTSGVAFCSMHITLASASSARYPTLYFLDATGQDGRIYVGYLGPHLDNTLTT